MSGVNFVKEKHTGRIALGLFKGSGDTLGLRTHPLALRIGKHHVERPLISFSLFSTLMFGHRTALKLMVLAEAGEVVLVDCL